MIARTLRLLLLSSLLVAAACGSPEATTCAGASDCATGERCVDSMCVPEVAGTDAGGMDAGPSPDELVSVRVEPASAALESVDGSMPTQAFALVGVQRDGDEIALPTASWSLDVARVGAIDDAGTFTANGAAGGVVTVTGRMTGTSGLSADATVTVSVRRTVFGPDVDPSAADSFAGTPVADPTAIELVYPLEGAVMPSNVYPPSVQWLPVGSAGDLFRVRVSKPHVELVGYLSSASPSFAHGWPVPRDAWRPIADSDPDEAITITVDRFETATSRLIAAAGPRTMRLARGNIFGAVYYEHRAGTANILRIDTEAATLADLIAQPIPNSGGTRCVGCHALSHDGRYAFATNAETSSVYDLTVDLSTDPPPTRYPLVAGPTTVASFDPTGAFFVGGNHVSGALTIFDATTGAVAPSTGLPTASAGYPSWSGDGMHVAYSGDVVVAPAGHPEPGDPIGGNLYVADRTGTTLDFAAPRLVHSGDSLASLPEGGTNDTHVTWSPDSRFLAFQHGPGTFTHVVRNAGALYLLGVDGALHRLDHANGGASGTDGYWPTFAPYVTVEADGRRYFWMAFYARRDYGNALLGTRGTGLRQLWVGAIDTEPTAGTDPSFVPYWLPGQSTSTSNFSAFWAPEACRATGADCSSASECCSDRCEADSSGAFSCAPPPPDECHRGGETCGGASDCCVGFECVANVCTEIIL